MTGRAILSGMGAAAVVVATLAAAPQSMAIGATAQHPIATSRMCDPHPAKDHATCYSEVVLNRHGATPHSVNPPASALTPAQLQHAYNLGGLSSSGRAVAIVDAYGYPNLERDLGVFRSYFGLPACTTSNGCLQIMDQNGGGNLPGSDLGWDGEQALDVDAVSSACPDCRIIVVQANTASFADLGTAVVTAAAQPGVAAISNSYGGGDASDATYGGYYNHPGIAVTASTGDSGYQGGSYPADSSYVTAVGGTSLVASGSARGFDETAWSGAGSGCSSYNAALSAAASYDTGCANRAMADVAAAADPNEGGLAVYYPISNTQSTWGQIGGTSESSPIIASVYALSGNTSGYANAIPYGNPGSLFDVTSGSNGSCSPSQWCNARPGWDGPTGLGTPNGDAAF